MAASKIKSTLQRPAIGNKEIKNLEDFFSTLSSAVSCFIEHGIKFEKGTLPTVFDEEMAKFSTKLTLRDLIKIALGKEVGAAFLEDLEEINVDQNSNLTLKMKASSRFSPKNVKSLERVLQSINAQFLQNAKLAATKRQDLHNKMQTQAQTTQTTTPNTIKRFNKSPEKGR